MRRLILLFGGCGFVIPSLKSPKYIPPGQNTCNLIFIVEYRQTGDAVLVYQRYRLPDITACFDGNRVPTHNLMSPLINRRRIVRSLCRRTNVGAHSLKEVAICNHPS